MSEPEIIPPISSSTRRRGAREALIAVAIAAVVLVVFQGPSIRRTGERLDPGPIRVAVLAVGRPSAWLADQLPFASGVQKLTSGLRPDEDLAAGKGGFSEPVAALAGFRPSRRRRSRPPTWARSPRRSGRCAPCW